MAQYELIDTYLGSLRQQIGWHRNADDLVDEARDHLLAAMERSQDVAPARAQQLVLDRFGDPALLAEAFASTTTGGIAVPTRFTRTAGIAGIIAAAAWVIALMFGWLAPDNDWGIFPWLIATGSTAVFTAGVYSRHGGALGVIGKVGMVAFYLGVAIAIPFFWAVPIYMSLMGAGLLLVGASAYRARLLPRLPTLILSVAMGVGAAVWAVGRALEIGDPDEWGDYIGVTQVSVVVGFGLFALAAAWIGRWLAAEEPADITPSDALIA